MHKDPKDGKYKSTLYNSKRAIVKVPNLAIHLIPLEERGKFAPNPENHLKPILSSEIYERLGELNPTNNKDYPLKKSHFAGLLQDISDKTGIELENIIDMDLCFYDMQAPQLVGLHESFISSARLDNLFSSWAAIEALTNPDFKVTSENSKYINLIVLFDHEECGSESF